MTVARWRPHIGCLCRDCWFGGDAGDLVCRAKFNTYIMCMNHFEGQDQSRCHTHKRHYLAMCPAEWVENFTSYISEDRWQGVQPSNPDLFDE